MGIFDDFEKKRRETQVIPPPKGHAISDILRDKTNSHLFGKLLEEHGEIDLGRKIYEGRLEEDDIAELSKYREKFSEKIERSETVEKLITKENVIEIARVSTEFAKIMDIVTPEQAVKIIREQLRKKCFEDETTFNIISDSIQQCADYKNGEYRKNEEEIEKMCESMGISTKSYLDAIEIKDPSKKKAALEKLVRGDASSGRNFWNMISRENKKRRNLLTEGESLLKKSIQELDYAREDLGKVLSLSITADDDMRNALAKELLSERTSTEAEKKVPFSEGKEMTTINEKDFQKDWEEVKTREGYDRAADDTERDLIKDTFLEEQRKKYEKKNAGRQGFWASIFATLLEEKIMDKKATLS